MATMPGMKIDLDLSEVKAASLALRDLGERMTIWFDVSAEINRARAKHGAQHDTPMGTGPDGSLMHELDVAAEDAGVLALDLLSNDELERAAKRMCQDAHNEGADTWAKIVFEEFCESMAAEGPELDAELVQLVAMGVSMLQAHRRQQAGR